MVASTASSSTQHASILVVDDELLVSQRLCEILNAYGYAASYELSGEDGLGRLDGTERFDLVVLDIDLGPSRAHGGAVAARIRDEYDIPVVFYTGHSDASTISLTSEAEAYGIVAKGPDDTEFLLASVANALHHWRVEHESHEQNRHLQRLLDGVPGPLCMVSQTDGRISYANAEFAGTFGAGPGIALNKAMGMGTSRATGSSDDAGPWTNAGPVQDEHDRSWVISSRELAEGDTLYLLCNVTPLCEQVDELEHDVGIADQLLREVNHRVKNNLTVVDSLIDIAQRTEPLADGFELLHEQVRAIRLLHQQLYTSRRHTRINAGTYLVSVARESFPVNAREEVDVRTEVPSLTLDGRVAMPLGLIVVELATNAHKHAFPASRDKWFQVRLEATQENRAAELFVEYGGEAIAIDAVEAVAGQGDGHGTSAGGDGHSVQRDGSGHGTSAGSEQGDERGAGVGSAAAGTGLNLVQGLVRQIDGSMHVENTPHMRFCIRFPLN